MRACATLCSVAAVLFLVGCGGSGSNLTPEQQAYVDQAQEQVSKLKSDSSDLLAELKKKAESPEAEKAAKALEAALADAQKVLADLRKADGASFDQKKAAVEQSLKDLGAKYADALAKNKLGGLKLPGM